jgi:hypothetical protein
MVLLGRRSVRVPSICSRCSRGKSPLRGNHLRVGENAKLSAGVEGKSPQAAAQQNVTPIPTQRCRRASRVRAASSFASCLKASLLTPSSPSLFHHNINQHNSALHHTSPLACLLHLTIRLHHQPINIIISEHAAHLTTFSLIHHPSPSIINHSSTTHQPLINHSSTTHQPLINHSSTTHQPLINHSSSTIHHQPSIVIIDVHHLPSTSIVFHIH